MNERTEQIVRAIWDITQCGQYTVRAYRVAERVGPLTVDDVTDLLATGVVTQIDGMGGPSSFRMAVSADDLHAYSVGEFHSRELETAAAVLTAGDEF